MKLGIINSAFYQAGVDTITGLKHIARIGFDCVDIHTEATEISKQQISAVAKTCEKLGLPIISLPVCSLGLADFAAPVREFHIERTKKFIDLARTWNAKNVCSCWVNTCGSGKSFRPRRNGSGRWKRAGGWENMRTRGASTLPSNSNL